MRVIRVALLVGREDTFPPALIQRINAVGGDVHAELAQVGALRMDAPIPYRLIVDRISHEVPYLRAYVKKAVADGVTVINNPFWWSADDKFFECVLAERLDVAVPKTVVLPNRSYEADLIDESLRNVAPIDWDSAVEYVGGFPTVLKPAIGGGWKNVTIARSMDELQRAYDDSGVLLMILQEFIAYENYVRCVVIGRRDVLISKYEPANDHFNRYVPGDPGLSASLRARVEGDCLTLCRALGYDMNTIEFAIRGGVPYAIDFLNPAPDFDISSLREEYFEWVVRHMADMVIQYARQGHSEPASLRWHDLMNEVPAL
jgi:glutathione synthase/RimK-type ligase-like ATP-grasp enzyme